ncbi:hypothetical protein RFI_08402 [Reticulomyxa filosa]|uniref:Uncharacterized protein n=1 Tax=Reticulomyxa filosa TaxID=46433 RepID=X6NSI9_RETFI|nr:hypothetical protein RFI_08402 [Reticulomyxa filosa]|eukprot:ETO28724.1 hypothetical protein RFI_08402 [Reticulomyxa filosa]
MAKTKKLLIHNNLVDQTCNHASIATDNQMTMDHAQSSPCLTEKGVTQLKEQEQEQEQDHTLSNQSEDNNTITVDDEPCGWKNAELDKENVNAKNPTKSFAVSKQEFAPLRKSRSVDGGIGLDVIANEKKDSPQYFTATQGLVTSPSPPSTLSRDIDPNFPAAMPCPTCLEERTDAELSTPASVASLSAKEEKKQMTLLLPSYIHHHNININIIIAKNKNKNKNNNAILEISMKTNKINDSDPLKARRAHSIESSRNLANRKQSNISNNTEDTHESGCCSHDCLFDEKSEQKPNVAKMVPTDQLLRAHSDGVAVTSKLVKSQMENYFCKVPTDNVFSLSFSPCTHI